MIVCTGSIALDTTRTPFAVFEKQLGGAGAFFSFCASFFTQVKLVGAVGDDFPETHVRSLEKRGVDLSGVLRGGKTFFVDWNYGHDLQARTYNALELNCLADFQPVVPESWKKSPYVYLGTTLPTQQLSILKQMDAPVFSLLDTIEYYIDHDRANLDAAISAVDGVLMNEIEARKYAGTANLVKAAKCIMDCGPTLVLIKKGENGCILFTKDFILPSPAMPLENVVDPTGAGDSFAGGFLGHLARTHKTDLQTFKEAMAFGHVMGSLAVEDFGFKRLFSATNKEIDERYALYRRMVCF